jgi:hypothetical protein
MRETWKHKSYETQLIFKKVIKYKGTNELITYAKTCKHKSY